MNLSNQLQKAIAALKPISDRDTIYADCLFHLESELRRLKEAPKPPPTDFLNYPADGWDKNKPE